VKKSAHKYITFTWKKATKCGLHISVIKKLLHKGEKIAQSAKNRPISKKSPNQQKIAQSVHLPRST
jgi:hypothetical protein